MVELPYAFEPGKADGVDVVDQIGQLFGYFLKRSSSKGEAFNFPLNRRSRKNSRPKDEKLFSVSLVQYREFSGRRQRGQG